MRRPKFKASINKCGYMRSGELLRCRSCEMVLISSLSKN